jgi:hypothetical protein
MKTLLGVLVCLLAVPAWAGNTRVEEQFSRSAKLAADAQIKAGAGYVELITCASADAAATAGTIVLYDSLTETGTELFRLEVIAAYLAPVTTPIHAPAMTGIFLGFTTTADVNCWVNYR